MIFLMSDFSFFCDIVEDDFWHFVSHGVAGDGAHLGLFFLEMFFCDGVHLMNFMPSRGTLNHLPFL